jgi:hypothetical protein
MRKPPVVLKFEYPETSDKMILVSASFRRKYPDQDHSDLYEFGRPCEIVLCKK